jgi:hypothetical protein
MISIAPEITNLIQILEHVFERLADRFAEIDEPRLSFALLNPQIVNEETNTLSQGANCTEGWVQF